MYLATCKICKTADSFRSRWNSGKSNKPDKNEKCMQEYLYSYSESEGHNRFPEDVSITHTDKTEGYDRTKRETFWMRSLKTLPPYGLNVENSI